jgi:hypothetical protein
MPSIKIGSIERLIWVNITSILSGTQFYVSSEIAEFIAPPNPGNFPPIPIIGNFSSEWRQLDSDQSIRCAKA